MIPSRIGALLERMERGETITQADVDRASTLVALDLAKAGEDFLQDWLNRQAEADSDV